MIRLAVLATVFIFKRKIMENKIYIGNLSFQVDPSDLIEEIERLFVACGEIDDISVIEDRATGRIKGFGFVSFATRDAAQSALKLDGQDLLGRALRVSMAKESIKEKA